MIDDDLARFACKVWLDDAGLERLRRALASDPPEELIELVEELGRDGVRAPSRSTRRA